MAVFDAVFMIVEAVIGLAGPIVGLIFLADGAGRNSAPKDWKKIFIGAGIFVGSFVAMYLIPGGFVFL